jgi:hypothetical protein
MGKQGEKMSRFLEDRYEFSESGTTCEVSPDTYTEEGIRLVGKVKVCIENLIEEFKPAAGTELAVFKSIVNEGITFAFNHHELAAPYIPWPNRKDDFNHLPGK